MKTLRSALVLLTLTFGWSAATAAEIGTTDFGPAEEMEQLVSRVALYPDPLIALILPASTHPSDIVLAARFLASGGNADAAASEPWDDSVKALTRYREVIEDLDRNLDWTRQLGEAFLDQRDAVMDAIQSVRARARANGLLLDTREQEVIVEDAEIRILPAQPTVIYVPRYDPEIIFVERTSYYYPRSFFTFGIGYGIGAWLSYDCDWRYHNVRIVHRPRYWYHTPNWRYRSHDHRWTHWKPSPRHDRRFDRRRDGGHYANRPRQEWRAPNHVSRPDHNRDRNRSWSDRSADRTRRPDFDRDRRRHWQRSDVATPARPVSAPSVVATSPNVPTAPSVVTQSPTGRRSGDYQRPPRVERRVERNDVPRRGAMERGQGRPEFRRDSTPGQRVATPRPAPQRSESRPQHRPRSDRDQRRNADQQQLN